MQKNYALKAVVGMVGLGVTGLITALLLTQQDDETSTNIPFLDPTKIKLYSGIHVPVTLTSDDEPSSDNPVVQAGDITAFTIAPQYTGIQTGSLLFYIKVTSLDRYTAPRPQPVQFDDPPPATLNVTIGTEETFRFAVKDTGREQHIQITVQANGQYGTVYDAKISVTVLPAPPDAGV